MVLPLVLFTLRENTWFGEHELGSIIYDDFRFHCIRLQLKLMRGAFSNANRFNIFLIIPNRLIDQSINQHINQSASQSNNQQINQSVSQKLEDH